jgi:hypothetical protein
MNKFSALVAASMLAVSPVAKADMTVISAPPSIGGVIAMFNGAITMDDANGFNALLRQQVVVAAGFNSPGGSAVAGMMIGESMRRNNLPGYVNRGDLCASACALAWLGSARRVATPTSRIGFHGVYTQTGGATATSGSGNALAGAYLSRLGYGYEFIAWATSAPPNGMQWLDSARAASINVQIR